MDTVRTTQGYYSVGICHKKKYFLLECGDIDEGFWRSKTIVLNAEQGRKLIQELENVISEIERTRDAKETNPSGQ